MCDWTHTTNKNVTSGGFSPFIHSVIGKTLFWLLAIYWTLFPFLAVALHTMVLGGCVWCAAREQCPGTHSRHTGRGRNRYGFWLRDGSTLSKPMATRRNSETSHTSVPDGVEPTGAAALSAGLCWLVDYIWGEGGFLRVSCCCNVLVIFPRNNVCPYWDTFWIEVHHSIALFHYAYLTFCTIVVQSVVLYFPRHWDGSKMCLHNE